MEVRDLLERFPLDTCISYMNLDARMTDRFTSASFLES